MLGATAASGGPQADMPFEIDHVFVWTAAGAPAAERLVDFGLTEGPSNHHPGQGTANRRFFFRNAMLELLWVTDPAAERVAEVAATGLHQRVRLLDRGASPFGLCLRPAGPGRHGKPFPGWPYHPPYLPPGLSVWVDADCLRLAQPFLFHLSFGRRPDRGDGPAPPRAMRHPRGFGEISRLAVSAPGLDPGAPAVAACNQLPGLDLSAGGPALLTIGFLRDVEDNDFERY